MRNQGAIWTPEGPTTISSTTRELDFGTPYQFDGDGAGGAADLAGLDRLIQSQQNDLPRLQRWVRGSIDVGSLIPGSDLVDPAPYLTKIFDAFRTGGLPDGKAFVFGRQRAWNFTTRPTADGTGSYFILPKRCKLEWQREWDVSAWAVTAFSRNILYQACTYGSAVTVLTDIVAGTTRTVTVTAGQASQFTRGRRVLLRATANLTNLTGAYSLQDGTGSFYARAEALVVQDNSGDTVTFYSAPRDNYDVSDTAPVLQLYNDEPDIHLINPMVIGQTPDLAWKGIWATTTVYSVGDGVIEGSTNYRCLIAHTAGTFATDLAAGRWEDLGSDKLLETVGADRVIVEGGWGRNLSGMFMRTSSVGTLIVRDHVGHGSDMHQGRPGGYFYTGGTTTGALFDNVETHGISQPFMQSPTGGDWGVTRDSLYRDCRAFRPGNGFSQHNMEEGTTYERCKVIQPTNSAFDIRTRRSKMKSCEVLQGASAAVFLRTVAVDFECDFLRVEKSLSGIVLTTFGGAHEYTPDRITITNSRMEDIGGVGSTGGIDMDYDIGSAPTLGALTLKNNYVKMNDNTRVYTIGGKWAAPIVHDNVSDGAGTGNACFFYDAGNGAGNGPIDINFQRHTYSATMAEPLIQNDTGRRVDRSHTKVGITSTLLVEKAASFVLDEGHFDMKFSNTGATAQVVFTLPAAILGQHFGPFFVTDSDGIQLLATGNDTFRIGDAAPGAAGGTITSTAVGAWVEVTAVSSSSWVAHVNDPADWTVA